ncbi:enoyl-CoA hydratase/isomerase family protein [Mycolicibacterium hodleri]|uniref:2-(1,2-epoxy-1,2-dihydrophenyl)acetyl-CoA isomerase n=1 Tax=Mycolicibacterium hodleri TaxID=49897 RepID=A0A502E6C7_9MYCO|nr:enoyl-CoA hydratase-related protein [Mycolicibacterium hodleri]TPG32382.1 2-(1,2-epoxy-1,2-dihydrophenyl)acetyl-CoA isomerase [Mycolicibacterium hodleri]
MTQLHVKTSPEGAVLVVRRGTVGVVTLNRPERLNALDPCTGDLLRSAFLDLQGDGNIRAVVLTGSGRGFCAGADISGEVGNAGAVLRDVWNPLVRTMRGLELPIIAAINGVAAGAGVSLALACDLRVAAESARIRLSFANVGLIPDAGLTWLLPRIIGLGRANELALLGRPLSATDALQWGLANRVCSDVTVLTEAIAMASTVADMAGSVSAIKHAHQRSWGSTFEEQLDFEAAKQSQLQLHPDFSEATTAFLEKRPAVRAHRIPPPRD